MVRQKYSKPSLNVSQQIDFLVKQGLGIEDHHLASHVLSVVSYYRFSGYLLPFKLTHISSQSREFKPETTFGQVWRLYQFDRELRLLVSDAIEKIEVAFRTALVNVTSITFGPFWYMDRSYFRHDKPFDLLLKTVEAIINGKQDVFLRHYFNKYKEPPYPPIWMIVEALSFGACSKIFNNIKSMPVRRKIAEQLGQHPTVIESWLQTLTYTRNLSAHHSRMWNRWFVKPPLIPKYGRLSQYFFTTKNYRFHLIAYILHQLLEKVAPHSQWKEKLFALFNQYEDFPGIEMGFKVNWQKDPFWEL